jgi:hypothetical protein
MDTHRQRANSAHQAPPPGTGDRMGAFADAWNSHARLIVMVGQQTRAVVSVRELLTQMDSTQVLARC